MRRAISRGALITVAMLAAGRPAMAQSGSDTQRVVPYPRATMAPQYSDGGIGIRIFGSVGFQMMTAKNTYEAVLGSAVVREIGGGADVTGLPGGLFLRIAGQRVRETGSRVFIVNDTVVSAGIPLTVEMTPIEFGGGWRSGNKESIVSFFVGAGGLLIGYKETSAGATPSENVSDRFLGYFGLAGFDLTFVRRVFIGAEGQYRMVPKALGDSGVSADFRETDLGGIVARLRIGIAF